MFNIIKGLTKAAVATVTLPVAVVADAVTMGGLLNGKDAMYTVEHAKKIIDGVEEATK